MNQSLTRPRFLASSNPPAGSALLDAADKPRPIIDPRVHCFADKADRRFPLHEKAPYQREKPAAPQDLLKAMNAAGVDYPVFVHPEPYQDDHRYQEYCLGVGGKHFKG